MKYASAFLIGVATASLLACGKSEEAPAPNEPMPAVETPAAAPEPVVEAAPPAQADVTQPIPPATAAAPAAAAETPPAPAVTSDATHGQQVYRQACAFCHDKGVAGAPKAGDKAAWGPRLAQGKDALYASALRGKGAMPAKGGNPALADADVKAAVDHLAALGR